MLGGAGCCPCPHRPPQDVPASPAPAGPSTRGAGGAGGAGDCRTGRGPGTESRVYARIPPGGERLFPRLGCGLGARGGSLQPPLGAAAVRGSRPGWGQPGGGLVRS